MRSREQRPLRHERDPRCGGGVETRWTCQCRATEDDYRRSTAFPRAVRKGAVRTQKTGSPAATPKTMQAVNTDADVVSNSSAYIPKGAQLRRIFPGRTTVGRREPKIRFCSFENSGLDTISPSRTSHVDRPQRDLASRFAG